MRIALVLSGQPRFYQKAFRTINKYLLTLTHSVDTFFHVWWSPEMIGQVYNRSPYRPLNNNDLTVNGNTLTNLLSMYKPKKYLAENHIQFVNKVYKNHQLCPPSKKCINKNNDFCSAPTNPNNIFSMYYSIKKADELRVEYEEENNFKYDWVIRYRFDCVLGEKINFAQFDNSNVYIVKRGIEHRGVYCDAFAFGNSDNMSMYSQTFSHLDEFWDEGVKMNGEEMLLANIKKYKLNIKVIPLKWEMVSSSNIDSLNY